MVQAVVRQPLTADTVALDSVVSSTSVLSCQYIPQILHAYRHSELLRPSHKAVLLQISGGIWTESFCDAAWDLTVHGVFLLLRAVSALQHLSKCVTRLCDGSRDSGII
jgi:hypothetical protein